MIEKQTLPSGARLLYEELPHVRSAAFGIWVGTGSRHETPALAGASHALEHMVFKGTKTRTAAQIAEQMDAMGGQLNAFTTKECTCFYGRALESHLTEALELICDIFFEAKLDEDDWQTERGVILEEIDMYEDTPEDLVTEQLFAQVYKGSTLAKPILGNAKILRAMTAQDLRSYRDAEYRDVVVTLAGCFKPSHRQLLEQRFAQAGKPARPHQAATTLQVARAVKKKAIEQNHWCLAMPGLPMVHDSRYDLQVMIGILGGGMSSRLFQAVREQAGLCYEISAYASSHQDVGLLGIYVALNRESEARALPMIRSIIETFVSEGPTEAEVDRAREQLKSAAVMGMEATKARMNHMGQSELLLGKVLSLDEIIDRCDAVTTAKVHALARDLLTLDALSFSAVGRVDKVETYKELLQLS